MANGAKKSLPKNGSDTSELESHLTKLHVWRLLLLYGSFGDGCGQEEIARKMRKAGVEVTAVQVGQLYHLAVQHAKLAA